MSLHSSASDQRSLRSDRPPTYASDVTAAPTYDGVRGHLNRRSGMSASISSASILSAPDSETSLDETAESLLDTTTAAETPSAATTPTSPRYVYYRLYAEDGAIPSKTSAMSDDYFLGRIKARSVPPPHIVNSLKRSIAKVEIISDRARTSLFLTPSSQSSMDDAGKVTILNPTSPGSILQEPLALFATLSDSERSTLESGGRSELASTSELSTTSLDSRYLYYLLYADDYELPSKAAFDPKEPSLGRIRADSIVPPHTPTSIKLCISRVERDPTLASANLFADISCDTPLTEGHIPVLRSDGLGE